MEADFKHTIRFYLHWIIYLVHNLAWIANNLAQIKEKCDLNSNLLFNHFLLDISSLCLIMMFNQNITLIYYILFNIRLFKKISHLGCQALLLQCMPPTNVSLVRSPGYLWFLKLHHPPPLPSEFLVTFQGGITGSAPVWDSYHIYHHHVVCEGKHQVSMAIFFLSVS